MKLLWISIHNADLQKYKAKQQMIFTLWCKMSDMPCLSLLWRVTFLNIALTGKFAIIDKYRPYSFYYQNSTDHLLVWDVNIHVREWKMVKILSALSTMLQTTYSVARDRGKAVVTVIIVMSNPTVPTLVEESKGEAAVQQNSLVQTAVCSKKFP